MKSELNKNQVGLTLGIFIAALHALWAILVGIGSAQKLIDIILPLHFIDILCRVTDFVLVYAIILVILAFVSSYAIGWLFAALWNWVGKKVK